MLTPKTCHDFGIRRQLGEGSFGQVYEVRSAHERYALKIRKWKEIYGIPGDILREASFLKQLQHPNVISCFGIFLGNCENVIMSPLPRQQNTIFFRSKRKYIGEIHFLLEYFPSNLSKFLQEVDAKYYGIRIFRFAQDLLRGLFFLHSNHFIHGDLKPDNILISIHPKESKRRLPIAKLADFGSTRLISSHFESPFIKGSQSIYFLHPQALFGDGYLYSFSSDIYSLSLVLMMMFFTQGQYPFDMIFFSKVNTVRWDWLHEEPEPMEVIFLFLVYILGHPPFALKEDLLLTDFYSNVINHLPVKGCGIETFLHLVFECDPRFNPSIFLKKRKVYLELCKEIFSWNPTLSMKEIVQKVPVGPKKVLVCEGKMDQKHTQGVAEIAQHIETKVGNVLLESVILHKTSVAIAEKYLFDTPTEWNEKMAALELFMCQLSQFEFVSLSKSCPSPPVSPHFRRQTFDEIYRE